MVVSDDLLVLIGYPGPAPVPATDSAISPALSPGAALSW